MAEWTGLVINKKSKVYIETKAMLFLRSNRTVIVRTGFKTALIRNETSSSRDVMDKIKIDQATVACKSKAKGLAIPAHLSCGYLACKLRTGDWLNWPRCV